MYSPDLVCLLKVVAPRAACSLYLLHQGCCWADHGAYVYTAPLTGGSRPVCDV